MRKIITVIVSVILAIALFAAGFFGSSLFRREELAPELPSEPDRGVDAESGSRVSDSGSAAVSSAEVSDTEPSPEEYLNYSLEEGENGYRLKYAAVKEGYDIKTVTLPAVLDGKPVREIADYFKLKASHADALIIAEGIERIGKWVMFDSIQYIHYPDSLKEIAEEGFLGFLKGSFRETPGDTGEGVLELPGADFGEFAIQTCVYPVSCVKIKEGCREIGLAAFRNATEFWLPSTVERCYCFCHREREYNEKGEEIAQRICFFVDPTGITIHYAGTPEQFQKIDFYYPLPEEVTVIYDG